MKTDYFNLPNLISYFRVALIPFAFWLYLSNHNAYIFVTLSIIIIGLDALDGIIARKLQLCTEFGAKLDIFTDRITELSYWYFFAHLGLLPFWIFYFFLIRGLIVDYHSRHHSKPLGNSFLRSSRIMRALYGSLKLLSFIFLILIPHYSVEGINLALGVTYLTVLICALRALPTLRSLSCDSSVA